MDRIIHAPLDPKEVRELRAGDYVYISGTIYSARDAAHNWIQVELDEFEGDLPFASHEEDIALKEGQFIRKISVTIKLLPDSD